MEKFFVLSILLVILCLRTRDLACKGETLLGDCLKADREALLDFKNGLKDSSNRLSSWTGGNCCQWEGIGCENNTGAVISINLRYKPYYYGEAYENGSSMILSGEIHPSLIELKSLRYLDLSGNSFENIPIPKFLGSLKNLQYLNLSNCGFNGAIPPTLGNLSNLQFLDLSSDEFQQSFFVNDLGWMTSLVSLKHLKMNYVNLSMVGSNWVEVLNKLPFLMELHLMNCGLSGPISSLSSINFTSLSVISINHNSLNSKFPIWLLNLSNLVYIDLSHNDLHEISPGLGELPDLQYLDLSWNEELTGNCSQLLSGSWKKIEYLDLGFNRFVGTIPSFIRNFCHLQHLDLSVNSLTGSLPEFPKEINNCSSEGVLPDLKYMSLSNNQLEGRLPEWLSQLGALTDLYLCYNKLRGPVPAFGTFQNLEYMEFQQNELNGSLPVSFGQLSELVYLDVSENHLSGILSEQHFSKLSKLETLKVNGNSGLILNVNSTWLPPFQITDLEMNSCNLGPSFPSWLRFQKEVSVLDFSNASISGSIPNWFWNDISSQLGYLSLSSNQLHGQLSNQLNAAPGASIDLSSNFFEGPIPLPHHGCNELYLSNNKFSGSIPAKIGESLPDLSLLSLSGNQITGIIPKSVGLIRFLGILDLSGNSLTGSIPSSISNCSYLSLLNLANNSLSGTIPKSFGRLERLLSLHLSNNKLVGEFPLSFQNLSRLKILELSDNKLSGDIPAWIGSAFTWLGILKLRSNAFSGGLHFELSNLSSLHILDLAENNLSGSIPSTLGDLKAMTQKRIISGYTYGTSLRSRSIEDGLMLNAKGQYREYIKSLSLIVSIDLSTNNFSGEFPAGVTKLSGLMFLNLSRNHINGSIPLNISRLSELSSLDLSSNNLYGIIPSSMSSLTFLSYLNLSNNNFSGEIPFKGQMTTFDEFAFAGNPRLCGPPLVAKCQGGNLDQGKGQSNIEDENDDGFIDQWFYLSIGLGFAVGILGPYFVLIIKKSWCEAYFSFVDKIVDISPSLRRRREAIGRNYRRR